MKFEELELKPMLIESLRRCHVENPTLVQEKTIPTLLKGKDMIVRSKTGSGKTFAFLLPILNNLKPDPVLQVLILVPTRELAHQIYKEIHKLDSRLQTVLLYGGVGINPQINALRKGAQIAVATPGRTLDHLNQRTLDFSRTHTVVLDEADRMFDMGFIDDVEKILKSTPKTKQMMLFSATMPEKVVALAQRHMHTPQEAMLEQDEITVKKIKQIVYGVDRKQKLGLLLDILRKAEKVIVFTNTKDWAERLSTILKRNGVRAVSLHSNLSQNKRNRVLIEFNTNKYDVLVATDVAARGLHIENVTHVVNYDIPRNPKDYIHRIGRTGRAGKEGEAITFVTHVEQPLLRAVENEITMFLEIKPLTSHAHNQHPRTETKPLHAPSAGDDWGLD